MNPQPSRVRIRRFDFRKDIIIRLTLENGRLRKELAERDKQIAKLKADVERQAKGIIGLLHGG